MSLAKEDYDFFEKSKDVDEILELSKKENEDAKELVRNDIDFYINDLTLEELTNLRIACWNITETFESQDTEFNLMVALGFEGVAELYLKIVEERYKKYLEIKNNS